MIGWLAKLFVGDERREVALNAPLRLERIGEDEVVECADNYIAELVAGAGLAEARIQIEPSPEYNDEAFVIGDFDFMTEDQISIILNGFDEKEEPVNPDRLKYDPKEGF